MSFPPPPGAWSPPPPAGPAPLDQPQFDATIRQATSRCWRKFATFSGRASRSEYWWWALVTGIISIALQLVGSLVVGGGLFLDASRPTFDLRTIMVPLVPALVWSLAAFVPTLAAAVRRLHDTNRSGWWYLLGLPSLIGLPFQLIGLGSLNPERLAAGDGSGVAIVPLLIGLGLALVGAVGSVILIVFLALGPDPRGARFDRLPVLG